jgi:hypothetical protein
MDLATTPGSSDLATGPTPSADLSVPPNPPPGSNDFFGGLPSGSAQLAVLCARGNTDNISKALCANPTPSINSITDLQAVIGLAFGKNNPSFALTGHSSSLVTQFVSAINPRALVYTPSPKCTPVPPATTCTTPSNPGFVAMGFVRGEQFVELVGHDPVQKTLRFFLVKYEQACTATGCTAGDLLTPAVEQNFTKVSVYEDIDVRNTIFDCLQCHQPGGPGTPKILRMQELQNPWTHFFRNSGSGGQALLADFHAAHGTTEDYGPIPAAKIDSSNPPSLQNLLDHNGFSKQPNEFQTSTIESQVKASAPGQPTVNVPPGTSAAWQTLYNAAAAGNFIPVPYHDVKVTDPTRLATLTSAYQSFLAGAL